jgi:hypothetical protein
VSPSRRSERAGAAAAAAASLSRREMVNVTSSRRAGAAQLSDGLKR